MLVCPDEWYVAIGGKKSRAFSKVSPGKLDVNKLLRGAPAWGRLITAEQDLDRGEKKKLVLSDPFLSYYYYLYCHFSCLESGVRSKFHMALHEFFKLLQSLHADFDLYTIDGNDVVKVTVLCEQTFARFQPLGKANIIAKMQQSHGIRAHEVEVVDNAALIAWCASNDMSIYTSLFNLEPVDEEAGSHAVFNSCHYNDWLVPISFIVGIYRTEQLPMILQYVVDRQGIIVLDALPEFKEPDFCSVPLDISAIFSTLVALQPNLRFTTFHDCDSINAIKAAHAQHFVAASELVNTVVKTQLTVVSGDKRDLNENIEIAHYASANCRDLLLLNASTRHLRHFPELRRLEVKASDASFNFMPIALLPLQFLSLTIYADQEDVALFAVPAGLINRTLTNLVLFFDGHVDIDRRLPVVSALLQYYPNIQHLKVDCLLPSFMQLYQQLPLSSLSLRRDFFEKDPLDFYDFVTDLPADLQSLSLLNFKADNTKAHDPSLLQSKLKQLEDVYLDIDREQEQEFVASFIVASFIVPSLKCIRITMPLTADLNALVDKLVGCQDLHTFKLKLFFVEGSVYNQQDLIGLVTVLSQLPGLRFCSLELVGRHQPDISDLDLDLSADAFPCVEDFTFFNLDGDQAAAFFATHPRLAILRDGDNHYTAMQRPAWPLFASNNPLLETKNATLLFEPLTSDIPAPDPRFYRLQVGDCRETPADLKLLTPSKDFTFFADLQEAGAQRKRSDYAYFYTQTLPITVTNSWQAIPSAYSQEKLYGFMVADEVRSSLKFAYSPSQGMHYIFSNEPLDLPLCYVLEVNPALNQFATTLNEPLLQAMRDFPDAQFAKQCQSAASCAAFGIKDVRLVDNDMGGFVEATDIETGNFLLLKSNQLPNNLQVYKPRTKKWESAAMALLPRQDRDRRLNLQLSRVNFAEQLPLWSGEENSPGAERGWSDLNSAEKALAIMAAPFAAAAALSRRRKERLNAQKGNFALGQQQALQGGYGYSDNEGQELQAVLRFRGINCPDPHPDKYRLQVFHRLNPHERSLYDAPIDELPNDIVIITPPRVADREQACAMQQAGRDYYEHAPYAIDATSKWQALPGLFPYEDMHCLVACHQSIHIGFSEKTRQHFVKADCSLSVMLHFFLEVNPAKKPSNKGFSTELRQEQNRFKKFDPSFQQKQVPANLSLFAFLEQLNRESKGDCMHRSLIILWLATQDRDYLSRLSVNAIQMVASQTHLYVECQVGENFFTIDLGGANAPLKVFDPQKNEWMSEEQFLSKQQRKLAALNPQLLTLSSVENRRFILPDAQACQKFAFILANQLKGAEVFFANEASDLCAQQASAVCYANGQAAIVPAPSGALYHFISGRQQGFIIIDASAMKDEELVAAINGLSETPRTMGSLDLPSGIEVILVCHQGSYAGTDLCSRFQSNIYLSIATEYLAEIEKQYMPLPVDEGSADMVSVNLFGDADELMTALFGQLSVNGTQLSHQPGLLNSADEGIATIACCRYQLDDSLIRLMQKLKANSQFWANGHPYTVPKIVFSNYRYNWLALLAPHEFVQKADQQQLQQCHVLNLQTLADFFPAYDIVDEEDGGLHETVGVLASSAGKTLNVFVTHNLSEDDWAKFLLAANKHAVKCRLHVLRQASLFPSAFLQASENVCYLQTFALPAPVFLAQDVFAATQELSSRCQQAPLVRTVDAVDSDDVSSTIAATFIDRHDLSVSLADAFLQLPTSEEQFIEKVQNYKKDMRIYAKRLVCDVIDALEKGRDVILRGQFSPELSQVLMPLILRFSPLGRSQAKLYILTKSAHAFACLQTERITLPMLAAASRAKKAKTIDFSVPNEDISQASAQAYESKRYALFANARQQYHFVILQGVTGVGKTEFISQFDPVFWGVEAVAAFRAAEPGKRIWFFDEFNFADDSIFIDGNGVWIGQSYLPLAAGDTIVLAMNPASYGRERKAVHPQLLEKAEVIEFERLPNACLYQHKLKPLLQFLKLTDESCEKIARILLAVYQKIAALSQTVERISARELQFMALLFISYYQRDTKLEALANYCALSVANALVNKEELTTLPAYENFAALKAQFDPRQEEVTEAGAQEGYVAVPEFDEAFVSIQHMLKVCRIVDAWPDLLNSYFDLREWNIEGLSGIGKTHFMRQQLVNAGFVQVTSLAQMASSVANFKPLLVAELERNYDKISKIEEAHQLQAYLQAKVDVFKTALKALKGSRFCVVAADMPADQKEKWLVTAFHAGIKVIMDERNINPTIESLTNHLLSGVDLQGQKAQKPGFAIFGSQNPVSMGARVDMRESEAQQRRMVAVKVPVLSRESQRAILRAKGLDSAIVRDLTHFYNKNFREVLDQANTTVKHLLKLDLGAMHEFLDCDEYTGALKRRFSSNIMQLNERVEESLADKKVTLVQLNALYQQTSALTYAIKCALYKENSEVKSKYNAFRFANEKELTHHFEEQEGLRLA